VGINGPLSRTRQLPVPARAVVGAVVVLVLLPADAALILLCTRKDRKEETKHTMNHYSDNRSVGIIQAKNSVRVL
jgi:hypothetical protein